MTSQNTAHTPHGPRRVALMPGRWRARRGLTVTNPRDTGILMHQDALPGADTRNDSRRGDEITTALAPAQPSESGGACQRANADVPDLAVVSLYG